MRSLVCLSLVGVALCGVGCQRDGLVPELLTVQDVAPRIVDGADELEITGQGFPVKKEARVTLRGALHRSGESPEASVAIDAVGTSQNDQKITFTLTDDARARFLGEAGIHGTFDGDVQVSFPAITPGALPITGTLRDVHLDVRAKNPRKTARDARDEEGRRALSTLGLEVEGDGRGIGLTVQRVAEGSPAEQGGVAVGDVLTAMDGVSLIDVGDAIPTGKKRFAELAIVRVGEVAPIERQVAVAGFRPKGSMDLVSVALVLGVAAGIALFFASPLAQLLTRIERAIASRGPRSGAGARGESMLVRALDAAASLFAVDLGRKKEHPLATIAPLAVFFFTSAAVSALPFRTLAEVRGVDVLTTLATLVIVSACLVFAAGGARSGARWSFGRATKATLTTIALFVPTILAAGGVVAMAGSLRLVDLARAQGGAPWGFHLVRTPVAPVLFLAFLFVAHLDLVPAVSAVPEASVATPTTVPPSAARAIAAAFVEWITVYALAALAAVLFLGGFELPGVDRALVENDIGYGAAASLALLLKTWMVALIVVAARRAIPRLRWDQALGALLRAVLPGTVAATAITVLVAYVEPDALTKRVVALVTTALVTLFVVHVARRANAARAGSVSHSALSPFL